MELFGLKPKTAPAIASASIAAAAGAPQPGNFLGYAVGALEEQALSVPTVARAISLLSTVAATLNLRTYSLQWTGQRYEKLYVEGETWMTRPDPRTTRNFVMAKTARDLILYGRAFWLVTSRYSGGFPASFQWLPANLCDTPDNAPPEWFGPVGKINFNGSPLDIAQVIQFHSGSMGIVYQGRRAIQIQLRLDQSAERFASNEIAAGYLQQKGGEPMSGEELAEMAAQWAAIRRTNAIGALNEHVTFESYDVDPSKLQLVEGREYQTKELSRLMDIPAYLLAIDQSGMTYANAQQARQDLILFGARPLLHAIQERLSMDDVLPRGRHVEFALDEYLAEFTETEITPPDFQPAEQLERTDDSFSR
jgi:phage portal protein BeeE